MAAFVYRYCSEICVTCSSVTADYRLCSLIPAKSEDDLKFGRMTNSSGEQPSIAIAIGCIAYLNERFLYEKGLFRSSASLTDVRLLHTKMMQGDVNKVRSETDPHVVTGLLQKTLKDMSPAAFAGVYEDILATVRSYPILFVPIILLFSLSCIGQLMYILTDKYHVFFTH